YLLNDAEAYRQATEKAIAERQLRHAPKHLDAQHKMNLAILNRHDVISIMLQQINTDLPEKIIHVINSGLIDLERLRISGEVAEKNAATDLQRELLKVIELKKLDLDNQIKEAR